MKATFGIYDAGIAYDAGNEKEVEQQGEEWKAATFYSSA